MPQPIDFQTEVAKVTAAERMQQIAGRVSLAAQQRQALEEERHRTEMETQVEQTDQPEGQQVEDKGKRKTPFSKRRRKRGPQVANDSQANEHHASGDEGCHFDVTV